MPATMLASRVQFHKQAPVGLGGLGRSSSALNGTPLAAHPAGCRCALHRRAAAAPARRMRVSATADPAAVPEPRLTGDDLKEANRKYMRSVFDFERWKKHRSSSRYLRHFLGITESRIVSGLAQPLLYVMTVTTGVALYHVAVEAGYLPEVAELKLATNAPFGLTSFALSLLLVFRTNSSYGRWDEARKMWGLVVNRSRDFTRQALGYIPSWQEELQTMMCRWVVAYSRSLMCHLRPGEDLEKELKDVLHPQELKALLASAHRPNYCVQVMTAVLREAQLPTGVRGNLDSTTAVPAGAAYRMDENLTVFADVTGGCERILRTPIPLSYTRHTSRFMMIWLTLLPFTLWDSCRWAMFPIALIISFLLLGIEEIGVQIEEPFTILPLEAICGTIETNVRELHAMHSAQGIAQQSENPDNKAVPATALVEAFFAGVPPPNGNGAVAEVTVEELRQKLLVQKL